MFLSTWKPFPRGPCLEDFFEVMGEDFHLADRNGNLWVDLRWPETKEGAVLWLELSRECGNDPSKPSDVWFPLRGPNWVRSISHSPEQEQVFVS